VDIFREEAFKIRNFFTLYLEIRLDEYVILYAHNKNDSNNHDIDLLVD
jgi:hypothetical protein